METPIITPSVDFSIVGITYFIGTKKGDQSKVSIKVDKKGTIEQFGVSATGAPIESVRPLKQKRYDFYKGDLKAYVSDQCNLESILTADATTTKEYRTAFESVKYGAIVQKFKDMAVDGADEAVDAIATHRASNTTENRLLGNLQRELSKPKKAPKVDKPETVGKDGMTPTQRKEVRAATAKAKAAYFAAHNIGFADGKPVLVAA